MNLFTELKRRNVFRVALFYVVAAWVVVQVAETVLPAFEVPDGVLRGLVIVLVIGLVPALVFSWIYEFTPDGIKRDSELSAADVQTSATGRKLNWATLIVALGAIVFITVDRMSPSPPRTAVSEPTAASAAPAFGSPVAEASIAVLPFANLGGRQEDEYFSDGMTEELLNVLARNTGLQVAARTSVFQFKGKGGDVREIGRTLGVGHVVEGSVRRDGERVRITAQLIRVADGFHVWSESFDREIESVFALQDEIARNLAEQLDSTLRGDAAAGARENVDPLAYDDFLKARALYRDRRDILEALQRFRSAVERDPSFATAWANLALACEVAGYHTTAAHQQIAGDRIACMRETVAHAVELAPTAAITLHAQANLARAQGRFLDAERLYNEAMARDSTYPDVREDYAEMLVAVGRVAESAAAAHTLVRLEPTSPLFWHRLAFVAIQIDDVELVDAVLARVESIDPRYFWTLTTPFRQAMCHGRFEQARVEIDRAFTVSPDASATLLFLFRWSQRDSGIDDRIARDLLRGAYLVDGASLAAAAGDTDLAFEILGTSRDRDKRFDAFRHMACSANATMLADPRAHALLREAGFEAYWREKGWPPQCRPLGEADFECRHAPFEPLPAAVRTSLTPATRESGSRGP